MKLTFSNQFCAVFDEVLGEKDFELFWNYIQTEEYQPIHRTQWRKIFKLSDGNSMEGPAYLSMSALNHNKIKSYPTGLGIDLLISQVRTLASEVAHWVGKEQEDWDYFSAKPYLYPCSTGLAWHDDFTDVTGAYIFYAHPEWNISWGGELLVAQEEPRTDRLHGKPVYGSNDPKIVGFHLDNEEQNKRIMNPGVGNYIMPKPNRLVFIKRGVSHTIKKVDPEAGDHVRCSVSGFFMRKK
jgi:hypothetical protein